MSVSELVGETFGGTGKMLRKLRELRTYRLHATDGDIGHLEQFYFDDRDWKIKYFVVDIGTWLHGKKVLMSPSAIIGVDAATKTINAAFTKQQVQESEDISRHKPEGLEQAHDYSLYLGLPYYLTHSFQEAYDEHLRSSKMVSRYHVMAVDGEIGQIQDGIADDETWTIQYVVSTVSNWWSAKKVLLPTEWILWINAAESNVYASLTRDNIATAPAFDPAKPLTNDLELALHNHYWDGLRSDSSRGSNTSLSQLNSEDLLSFVSLLESLDARSHRGH
jgi:hypothetical protein